MSVVKGLWTIGRVFGIPVAIHPSWLAILGLIVWSLGADYFPMHHPGLAGGESWPLALLAAILFFASVLVHELAHSLAARAQGVPVTGITLFLLGGLSGLRGEISRPRTELTVAAAGPLASLVLAAAFAAAWRVALPWNMPIAAAAFYLAFGNLALAVFNLLPGFPLDGGRVLRAVVWWVRGDSDHATRVAVSAGKAVAVVLGLYGLAATLLLSWPSGLWSVLVAWFLWDTASEEAVRADLSAALRGRPIWPFLRRAIVVFDAEDRLAGAAERILDAEEQSAYPVLGSTGFIGLVVPTDFALVERARWPAVSTGWLARRVQRRGDILLGADALTALGKLDEMQQEAAPVLDGEGRLEGLIERSALLRWVDLSRHGARSAPRV
ncbi:MAG: site-2 protease family protein [Elusimicrobia bacterium]|nr:site-2 protease family protein [Elusimicrobiota bacterium]